MKKRFALNEPSRPQPAHPLRALFGFVARGTCGSASSPKRKAASPKKRIKVRIHVQMLPDFAFDKNPVIVNISDASSI
jgi:hypothetical protein